MLMSKGKTPQEQQNVADTVELNKLSIDSGQDIITLLELRQADRNGRYLLH